MFFVCIESFEMRMDTEQFRCPFYGPYGVRKFYHQIGRVSPKRITPWKDYFTGLRNAFIGTISFANTSVSPVSSMRSAGETES